MGNATSKAIPRRRVVDHDPSLPTHRKVAIVGIGCRYANGIDDAQKFWKMLVDGMDCTSPPPDDRFDTSYFLYPGGPTNKVAGKMYNQRGGYLKYDVYSFDRQFFKIPPDEAEYMDPQVRLLLEVVFEGLEDAGLPPSHVRGSNTGVYVGLTASEYATLASYPPGNVSQYSNSGANSCMASNRISYEFDLKGPSYTIDTACSSSLYSIHQACEAIRNGDCEMAVAGGANLLLLPDTSIGFCQAGMLSPDGKCKSFDASADGYSRSEGAGVVILKPLAKAVEDGDQIYAVVRGGALTNDGRTPGIANPSYEAQLDLVDRAYKHAQVSPHDVQYVEAHGTGTQVGDTTEANALGEGMARMRPKQKKPLYIGSVKSNFGHTEGAAGVAGVIKIALCLKKKKIPRVVHFQEGNPNIDFKKNGVEVPDRLTAWPQVSKRIAGCSSFGFGGANAHIVLEEFISSDAVCKNVEMEVQREFAEISAQINQKSNIDPFPTLLMTSAATKEGLQRRISDWITYLENDIGEDFQEFANAVYTSALKTQHHSHRCAVICRRKEEAISELKGKLEGRPSENYIESTARDSYQSHLVFVFSGMGTQWWGMTRQLMITVSSFRETMKKIDKILRKCGAKWSLVKLLTDETDKDLINKTEIAQPSICAVQIGLVELWRLCGVNPHAIVGHSVGEVAAAYTAGLLTLEDAVRVIYNRGRQLRHTSGSGTMLAVLHPVEEVKMKLEKSSLQHTLDVAAINSPTQIVLSGETSVIQAFSSTLKQENIKNVVLKVNNAFHSYQQEAIKSWFLKKVRFLSESAENAQSKYGPTIPMMSTVTNEFITRKDALDPNYWYRNIRQQVKFMPAVQNLLAEGYTNFLEISPNPALKPALNDIFAANTSRHSKPFTTHSLKRPRDINTLSDDLKDLMQSFGKLYVEGCQVDLESLFSIGQYKKCPIPSYPWQRVKCSCETPSSRDLYRFPMENHALLGKRQELSHLLNSHSSVWKSDISTVTIPWLKDHVVQGNVIVPAAAYVETALAAAREFYPSEGDIILKNLQFERFLFAPDSAIATTALETTVQEEDGERKKLFLRSKDANSGLWVQHSTMEICSSSNTDETIINTFKPESTLNIESIEKKFNMVLQTEDFFKLAEECGFKLGSSFQCTTKFQFSSDSAESIVFSEMSQEVQRESRRYIFHPAFLDAIFQGYAVLKYFITKRNAEAANLPFNLQFGVPSSMKEMVLKGRAPRSVVFYIELTQTGDEFLADVSVANAKTMEIFCEMKGFKFAEIRSSSDKQLLWYTEWDKISTISSDGQYTQDMAMQKSSKLRKYLIIGDETNFASHFRSKLDENGDENIGISCKSPTNKSWKAEFEEVCKMYGPTDIVFAAALTGNHDAESLLEWNTFEETQGVCGILCVSAYNSLTTVYKESYPNLWLITQGALAATDLEETQPAMTGVTAVGSTILHENPEFPVYMVDLPLNHDSSDLAISAFHFLCKPLLYENQIALRPCGHDEGAFHMYAPRIKVQPMTSYHGSVKTQAWKLVDNGDTSWKIKTHKYEYKGRLPEGKVEVEVICYMPLLNKGENNESTESVMFIFSGRVYGSDLMWGILQEGDLVVGVSHSELTSTTLIDANFLCKIPEAISAAEAITATVHLLGPFINITDAPDMEGGLRVLVYVDDTNDTVGEATVNLARSLRLKTQTVMLDSKGGENKSTSDYHSGSERSSPMSEMDDEYDVIIFTDATTVKKNELQKLCSKLKPMGKIVFLKSEMISEKTRSALPPLANVAVTNSHTVMANLASSRFFQQKTTELLQTLSKSSEDFRKVLERLTDKNHMSEISKQRSIKLNETIVTVNKEEFSIPIDFESTDFIANENASYIVTGGTKGFGCEMIDWLVKCGAKHVIIFSRNKNPEEEVQKRFTKLRRSGASIEVMQVDVSSYDQVERALRKIKSDDATPPVEGIFHCAVVYADTLLPALKPQIWNDVIAVKGYGALVLHKLTVQMEFPIKHFVLLSSIVALLGNAGQANYCSANRYLVSLAELRRSQGLPATVLYGGVINSTGFAVRQGYVKLWEDKGVKSVSPSQLLAVLGTMLTADCQALGLTATYNKEKYFSKNKHLILTHARNGEGRFSIFKALFALKELNLYSQDDTFANKLRSEEPSKALAVIEDDLCNSLKKILGIGDEIPRNSSPFALGINSQKSSEFSFLIEENFDVLIPPVDFLNDQVTIISLSEIVYRKLMSKGKDQSIAELPTTEKQGPSLLVIKGPTEDYKVQLVCFPPNGGGLSLYHNWHGPLNKQGVQTIVVQLPGWEGREKEKPLGQLRDIVSLVAEELKPILMQGRFAFYGHSMGGLIAFEVAHYLLEKYGICPAHLYVGGWYAPSMSYPYPNDYNVPMSVLRTTTNVPNTLKEYGADFKFIENDVLNNPAVLARLLPCVEVGLDICKMYQGSKTTQLPCDLTVFTGKKDEYVKQDMVEGWRKEIFKLAKFKRVVVSGRHLFLATCSQTIIKEILSSLPVSFNGVVAEKSLTLKSGKVDMGVQVGETFVNGSLSQFY
ncbi:phenolphthiocerol/phthiocerol polyketide synthase subunit C-like [Ptychodera flava]|uniref:phenolphthiocerol/phthiocerol polyketide synthase subunit C-like n=1 Tax=Ptychodera flava TaxID=63121 RepID=UPI003969D260